MRQASLLFVLALTSNAVCFVAAAQSDRAGFAADRYEPAERGSEWFVLDSLDLRGRARPALGATVDYGRKPLVLYDDDGEEIRPLIDHQLFLHVGASLVIVDRLRLAANLPIATLVLGEGGLVGEQQVEVDEGAQLGDVRASADLRLFGVYGGPITGALGVSVWFPSGSRAAFTGDGNVRVSPHLALAGEIARFNYALRLGFNYRPQDAMLSGSQLGSELFWAASMGVRAARGLLIGPEVYGSTVVQDGAFRRRGSPVEGVFGIHYLIANAVRIGAGVGPGFTQGFGTPEIRALFSLEWAPGIDEPPPDRDHDGILDAVDACPDVPGVASDDPKKHGCPRSDRDGDKILDEVDACPDVPGVASADPKNHGCPDRDRDGILDDVDACPDTKGRATDDPRTNGCPDTDRDGIFDPLDACPTIPGPANEDPAKNGCPPARIERGQIRITEQVQFKTDSAEILSVSDGILQAVQAIFNEHPEVTKVSVEGHTDNVGSAKYNLGLSQRRAASVVTWLVHHGISPARLTSTGYGFDRPIDVNDTAQGRANNRRVEFHIREIDGKPTNAEQE